MSLRRRYGLVTQSLSGLIVFLGAGVLNAAEPPVPAAARPVRWRAGVWQPPARSAEQAKQALSAYANVGARQHVLVQFGGPVNPQQRAALSAAGLHLLNFLGADTYFARVEPSEFQAERIAEVLPVAAASAIEPNWKIDPVLARREFPGFAKVGQQDSENPTVAVYVLLHRDEPLAATAWTLVDAHGGRLRSTLASINALVLELPADEIPRLAERDAVQWIEAPLRLEPVNDMGRVATQAEIVQAPPYGLDGSGVSVLVYDAGTIHEEHPDFGGRVTVGDSLAAIDHATHCGGTVGGSGLLSGGLYRGMAPAVDLISYGYEGWQLGVFLYSDPGDIEHDYGEAIQLYGADLATNSIGTNVCNNGMPCALNGNYGIVGAVIDEVARGALGRPLPILWACGNERACDRCVLEGETTPEGYHSVVPPACAKNQIGVGAVNSDDGSVTWFTSWGPCDDGRIKPDICAPGCKTHGRVVSTVGSGEYAAYCGTSMASPAAAGVTALLLQDLRAQFPTRPDPRGATVKVLLTHTAADLGNPGPDYQSGFGAVRIQQTIDFARSGQFHERQVGHGEYVHFLVDVGAGAEPLAVTLAWDDPPASPTVVNALVNDLELRVYDPDGVQHFPWTLDPNNPGAPAVRTAVDHLNNIEQVRVDAPAAGRWRVEVYGYNVPEGPQDFSIAGSPTFWLDCDNNQVPDEEQIAADPSLDCTGNGVLDICELDCNNNGRADSCDIAEGVSNDCEPDGEPDECEPDCNANGRADPCDILAGMSTDCDGNGVLDECQDTSADCNANGTWDACDIASGASTDINANGVPDDCEMPGDIIYVDDCDAGGLGTSDNPYCRLRCAIELAAPGSAIIVRDGCYTGPDNINLHFGGKDLTLVSEHGPEACVIDCNGMGRAFTLYEGETAATRIEGFTIVNGYHFFSGGGIDCDNGGATIVNCVFRDCMALGVMGGGIGGGFAAVNSPQSALIDCTFEGCTASHGGGAHFLNGGTIERCTFRDNHALCAGSGLYLEPLDPPVSVRNSVFDGNTIGDECIEGGGGAVHVQVVGDVAIENCTFVNNAAAEGAAVLAIGNHTHVLLENSIVWNNTSANGTDVMVYHTTNNYFPAYLTVRYCDIQGGEAAVTVCPTYCFLDWGPGNIDADPLLLTPSDFHLRSDSPCVDAGDPDFVPAADEKDIDGQPRIENGQVDLGADEFMLDCNHNGVPDHADIASGTSQDDNGNGVPDECEACIGDLNCDGQVSFGDINPFVLRLSNPAAYAANFPGCPDANSDINGDGAVNFGDINPFVTLLSGGSLPIMCP